MNTTDELKDRFLELGYNVIGFPNGFKGRSQEKLYIQDAEGYKYYIDLYHIEKGFEPEKFRSTNPFTIENIKLWLNKNNKTFTLVSATYVNSSTPLEWYCNICNKTFFLCWSNIITGYGCRHCKYASWSNIKSKPKDEKDTLLYQYPDIAKEWDYVLNNDRPEDYKPKSGKKKWWLCQFCNHSYEATIAHRARDKSSCPRCKMSHGEIEIYNFLTNNKIPFVQQYSFPDCKNIKPLPFDFYLSKYNLCIEFQGKQHYYPYDFQAFSYTTKIAYDNFERITKNDNIKREYCKSNNINLLEIPYTKINTIPDILSAVLNLKV